METNTTIMNYTELTDEELQEINGGIAVIDDIAAVAGICAAGYALSYGAGKAWAYMTN